MCMFERINIASEVRRRREGEEISYLDGGGRAVNERRGGGGGHDRLPALLAGDAKEAERRRLHACS